MSNGAPAGRSARSRVIVMTGVFFALPLFLSILLGLDAFETGPGMLPLSLAPILMGAGMGALASQLGNIMVSAVPVERSGGRCGAGWWW